ncbi:MULTISPECIES: DUF7701 domain-containing protein [unclassified Nocardioides]|uniref:DUF7701 domain-containing protein n=1 Tax=unclassified Nocardioides TaxID=2615069 RepID=UPI00301516A0
MSYLADDAMRVRASVPDGTEVPDDADDLFLLYAVLMNVKGDQVTAGDVHDAWTAWMELNGQDHESMRPFSELARDVQAEDEPFVTAIRVAARRRGA